MTCVPNKDSGLPRGHPPSLIRAFAVHLKTVWIQSYKVHGEDSDHRTGQNAQVDCIFAGSRGHLFVLLGSTQVLIIFSRIVAN